MVKYVSAKNRTIQRDDHPTASLRHFASTNGPIRLKVHVAGNRWFVWGKEKHDSLKYNYSCLTATGIKTTFPAANTIHTVHTYLFYIFWSLAFFLPCECLVRRSATALLHFVGSAYSLKRQYCLQVVCCSCI